ncbi:MAG: sulfatase-like hydrolase/transferase [Pseudomonadota bacterium]
MRLALRAKTYVLAALTFTVLAMPSLAADRPNVVILVADDLGWADVGYHGNTQIDTPSLDRLAREGVQLDRFYTTPICSPTRAALMTGRDPIRLGVAYATIMPWQNNGVHTEETFLPELFQDAGYQTAMVGKWHLGHSQQVFHPNARGFEHFYGHLHTEVGFFPPFGNLDGKDFQRNGVSIDDQGYETYLLADEVSRYIKERDQEKPFFVYMPFIAPHTPHDAPDDLKEKYADLKDEREPARSEMTDRTRLMNKMMMQPSARPMYAAVVEGMDRAIGQVLDTLESEGVADNTIVLFFSDNGGAAYAYGGADNAPLRGGKGETFEGGIRVVASIRWPERIAAGGKMQSIMSVMDVLPTLTAAAGIDAETTFPLDGKNMLPAIAEGVDMPREDYLFFISETPIRNQHKITAFNDDWKLVQEMKAGLSSVEITNYLFRIDEDPYEYNNLAEQYPKVVAELSKEIHHWRSLYPVSGTRSELVPPPGWHAPKDWAEYPRPMEQLQDGPSRGIPPARALKPLDWQYGEAGRLIYNCEPYKWAGGGLCK